MIKTSEELEIFLSSDNTIIVLDSSSFLDLYRYEAMVSKNLLLVYEEVKDKIWIPRQVFEEYLEHSEELHRQQFNSLEKIPKSIESDIKKMKQSIKTQLKVAKRFFYPQVSQIEGELETKLGELSEIANQYKTVVNNDTSEKKEYQRENHPKLFIDDLNSLQKIGSGFNKFEKIDIYSEGEMRYRLSIPPGFEDAKPKDKKDELKIKKYGDLLVWKEILRKASERTCSVLFITSDIKSDWWQLDADKRIIEKHNDLVEEFTFSTSLPANNFEMLYTGDFFRLMSELKTEKSLEESLKNIETTYTLSSYNIFLNYFPITDLHDTLDEKLSLTYFFIHQGDLQEFVPEPIADVEIIEISEIELDDVEFHSDNNYFYLDANLRANLEARVDCPGYEDELLSYVYNITISFEINLSIPLMQISDFSEEPETNLQKTFEAKELIDVENMIVNFSSSEIISILEIESPYQDSFDTPNICNLCKIRPASFVNINEKNVCSLCLNSQQICPKCGNIYPENTFFGPFCDSCED